MTNATFKIINYGTPEYRTTVALREEILRKPLGQAFTREELDKEKDHIQIVGFHGDEIIATAVLAPEGMQVKIQRVVVKNSRQGSGIGSQMMAFCEAEAKTRGFRSIYCHARDSAVKFYLQNNYIPESDYFDEDTVPHLKMRKFLTLNMHASTPKDVEIIDNKIDKFNNKQVPFTQEPTLILKNYVIKDGEVIIAGINAFVYYWGILHINVLFVDEKYRGQHLGSTLLKKVEMEAKTMGAPLVHLDTFDFQAKDFYLKHGYEIFGILEDCPKGHKRYYLKKNL